jgi:hypothetical protein
VLTPFLSAFSDVVIRSLELLSSTICVGLCPAPYTHADQVESYDVNRSSPPVSGKLGVAFCMVRTILPALTRLRFGHFLITMTVYLQTYMKRKMTTHIDGSFHKTADSHLLRVRRSRRCLMVSHQLINQSSMTRYNPGMASEKAFLIRSWKHFHYLFGPG